LMTWRPFSATKMRIRRPASASWPCRNATPRLSGTSRSRLRYAPRPSRRTRAGPVLQGGQDRSRFLRGELAFRDQFEKSFELARHGSTSSTGQGVRPPRPRRSRPAPVPGERRALGLGRVFGLVLARSAGLVRAPAFFGLLRPRPFGRPRLRSAQALCRRPHPGHSTAGSRPERELPPRPLHRRAGSEDAQAAGRGN